MASTKIFHLAYPISDELKSRTDRVIRDIRAAEDPRSYVAPLTDVIMDLTQEGLQYLFVQSLESARVSNVYIQAVKIGVNTSKKGLELVGRTVLKSMTGDNLLGIVNYMEGLLVEVEMIEE